MVRSIEYTEFSQNFKYFDKSIERGFVFYENIFKL